MGLNGASLGSGGQLAPGAIAGIVVVSHARRMTQALTASLLSPLAACIVPWAPHLAFSLGLVLSKRSAQSRLQGQQTDIASNSVRFSPWDAEKGIFLLHPPKGSDQCRI